VARSYDRELRKLLSAAGCIPVRKGKGDHEVWHSPVNGRHFTLDRGVKSRHTANGILKQAGLDKAF
jgi:hypothetical protein